SSPLLRPPVPPLFPYTTLFRSAHRRRGHLPHHALGHLPHDERHAPDDHPRAVARFVPRARGGALLHSRRPGRLHRHRRDLYLRVRHLVRAHDRVRRGRVDHRPAHRTGHLPRADDPHPATEGSTLTTPLIP